MRLRAFWIEGKSVIQCCFGFGRVSLTDRQRCVSHFKIRAIALREFLQLLFCRLALLRGDGCLRQNGKSRSVAGGLLQNLGGFPESLTRLPYSEINQGKVVAIVQILRSELARFQEKRRRLQRDAFVRPHCP